MPPEKREEYSASRNRIDARTANAVTTTTNQCRDRDDQGRLLTHTLRSMAGTTTIRARSVHGAGLVGDLRREGEQWKSTSARRRQRETDEEEPRACQGLLEADHAAIAGQQDLAAQLL